MDSELDQMMEMDRREAEDMYNVDDEKSCNYINQFLIQMILI